MAQISDRQNPSRKIAVNEDGSINVNAEIVLATDPEIQLGAVEIKDHTSEDRVNITASNELLTNVNNTVTVDATGEGDIPVTLDSEVVAVDATGQGDIPITLDSEVVAVDATGQGDIPITLDSEVVAVDATGQGDIPITLDSEVVAVDATGQGDIPITLDSEVVAVDATSQGNLPTLEVTPTTVGNAQATVTTAGTSVQLGTNDCVSVSVKASSGNTGVIYIGDSSVDSTNGFELSAGDSISVAIDNTDGLYIDSAENGDKVSYIFIN